MIPSVDILAAHTPIGLGTALGGWRIVKTMGSRITKLRPFGVSARRRRGGDLDSHRVALGCRSAPPTRSPGPSWASARRSGARRCDGASRPDRVGVDPHDPDERGDRGDRLPDSEEDLSRSLHPLGFNGRTVVGDQSQGGGASGLGLPQNQMRAIPRSPPLVGDRIPRRESAPRPIAPPTRDSPPRRPRWPR